jgi:hypothetical protein
MAALREVSAFDFGERPMRLPDVIDAYVTHQRSLGMPFDSAAQLFRHYSEQ